MADGSSIAPSKSADNPAIGRLAAEHLLHYEHTNFAWFSSTRSLYGDLRLEGFRSALSRRGYTVQRIDGKGCQSSEVMLQRLQQLERPCAILTMDDGDAGWLSNLCQNAGYHVPMDFAILGTDNNPLVCEVQSVPLSSIDKNVSQIVAQGAKRLDCLMNGADDLADAIEYVQPSAVVTRASTDGFVVEDLLVRDALSFLQLHLSEKVGTPEVAAVLGFLRLVESAFQPVDAYELASSIDADAVARGSDFIKHDQLESESYCRSDWLHACCAFKYSFRKHCACGTRAYQRC